jgi:hypothetical protein
MYLIDTSDNNQVVVKDDVENGNSDFFKFQNFGKGIYKTIP